MQEWPDNSIYFLTDSTFLHYPYFNNENKKQLVLNQIVKIKERFFTPVSAYSIACNHYHLLLYLKQSRDLPTIKQYLRGGISHEYRKRYKSRYKEIWQSRKIKIIQNEKTYWKVMCYIAGNLLKHREVSTFKELKESKFSSYYHLTEKYGEDPINDMIRNVIDFEENADGDVTYKN